VPMCCSHKSWPGVTMRPEVVARLQSIIRGGFNDMHAVTVVPVVTGNQGYDVNSLTLQRLRQLRHENTKEENTAKAVVTDAVAPLAEPDPVALEERKATAMGAVPERYLDAWARLQLQCPAGIDEVLWQRAVDDAGLFLDQWGRTAARYGWTPGELFNVPAAGKQGGLIWFLGGERLRLLTERRVFTLLGRVFER